MTRETKIGLLVGLAFIIVIGILLSDHLTSSTEPPQAALAGAGRNVRSGVTTPGSAVQQLAPVNPPISVAPQQQVATQNELAPRPDPISIVKVGPSNDSTSTDNKPANEATPVKISLADASASHTVTTSETPELKAAATADKTPTIPASATPISAIAAQHGEELVPLDSNGRAIASNTSKTASKSGMIDYKVEAGDSLSKIAAKVMGTNSRANREAIIAANPSLKENPDRIVVGKTYHVPAVASTVASASQTNSTALIDTNLHPPKNDSPAPAPTPKELAKVDVPANESFYIVKTGDSLWRIANDQCGASSAVDAIKELNKSTLKGENHDVVIVGSKLKLPGKAVASAS